MNYKGRSLLLFFNARSYNKCSTSLHRTRLPLRSGGSVPCSVHRGTWDNPICHVRHKKIAWDLIE